MSTSLTSFPSLVEAPFIIVKVGDYTFGSYTKSGSYSSAQVTFPNYMKSLNITKVNGMVNIYSIRMEYAISFGDDPNRLDKIFSSVSDTREITLSYGDWSSPSYIYREETAIITKVDSQVDFNNAKISYTISCTSDSNLLASAKFNFPKRVMKGSDALKEVLFNKKYGMQEVFSGMRSKQSVLDNNLIASDDKVITLNSKTACSPLDYTNYVVNCMQPLDSSGGKYMVSVNDDTKSSVGGTYFKVSKLVSDASEVSSLDTFSIDVGYPGDNFVTNFSLKNDQSWSILYKYSGDIDPDSYNYKIGDGGELISTYAPSILTSRKSMGSTAAMSAWWNSMTQFPIQATITIKGLIRPAILMSYVKINALFYGQKHVSSGLYIISKQQDTVDASGYKTTLSLIRVGADS